VSILKAGGDAGQLGKTFTLAVKPDGTRQSWGGQRRPADRRRHQPVAARRGRPRRGVLVSERPASTRQRAASVAKSILTCALGAAIAYQEVQDQFTSAAPKAPDWESLAADLPPAAVLGRACLHTLARSPGCARFAAELTTELPYLGVAQGEAKVRQVLRNAGPSARFGAAGGRLGTRPWRCCATSPSGRRGGSRLTLPGTSCRSDPENHHD
jgi:hypothetical protein